MSSGMCLRILVKDCSDRCNKSMIFVYKVVYSISTSFDIHRFHNMVKIAASLISVAIILTQFECGLTGRLVRDEHILEHPKVEKEYAPGFWRAWVFCSKGKAATELSVKVHKSQGPQEDDSGLAGVGITCWDLEQTEHQAERIGESVPGDIINWRLTYWSSSATCPVGTFANQFDFATQTHQKDDDDTSARGIKLKCTGGKELVQPLEFEEPLKNIIWSGYKKCPSEKVICGVSVKREENEKESEDKIGLGDVRFYCCDPNEEPEPEPCLVC